MILFIGLGCLLAGIITVVIHRLVVSVRILRDVRRVLRLQLAAADDANRTLLVGRDRLIRQRDKARRNHEIQRDSNSECARKHGEQTARKNRMISDLQSQNQHHVTAFRKQFNELKEAQGTVKACRESLRMGHHFHGIVMATLGVEKTATVGTDTINAKEEIRRLKIGPPPLGESKLRIACDAWKGEVKELQRLLQNSRDDNKAAVIALHRISRGGFVPAVPIARKFFRDQGAKL